MCFGIAKLECQKPNIIGYFFSISYMRMHDLLKKEKYAKKNKKQKELEVLGNTFNLHSNSTLGPRSVVSQSVSKEE